MIVLSKEIEMLKRYYKDNHLGNVFCVKKVSGTESFIIYKTNDKRKETDMFSEKFIHYLPFYIRSRDVLDTITVDLNVAEELIRRSKSIIKSSTIVPKRNIASNGIYGELFLDFYLRIIKSGKALISYAEKSPFKDNTERKGIDNVTYIINESKVEPVFAEAKFVSTKSAAKLGLKDDIKSHFNEKYLNDYISFIVEKHTLLDKDSKDIMMLRNFFEHLNKELDNGNDFISILIENKIVVNVVLFAIFTDESGDEKYIDNMYNELHKELSDNLSVMGFSDFNIEIIFIPTKTAAMIIKGAIHDEY